MNLFREVNEMELKLYEEITRPAREWADEHLTPEMVENGPPPELRELFHASRARIEHIGFFYTPLGLMIRDEPDVLVGQPVAVMEWSAAQANEQIDRIMRMK